MEAICDRMMLDGYCLAQLLHDAGDGRKVFLAHSMADGSRRAVIKVSPLLEATASSRLTGEFTILRLVACDSVVSALGYGVSLSEKIEYLILQNHGLSLAAVLA